MADINNRLKIGARHLPFAWSKFPGAQRKIWLKISSLVNAFYISTAETKVEVGSGFNLNIRCRLKGFIKVFSMNYRPYIFAGCF